MVESSYVVFIKLLSVVLGFPTVFVILGAALNDRPVFEGRQSGNGSGVIWLRNLIIIWSMILLILLTIWLFLSSAILDSYYETVTWGEFFVFFTAPIRWIPFEVALLSITLFFMYLVIARGDDSFAS